jgi:tetratricopeptide (TPR) repeat protein
MSEGSDGYQDSRHTGELPDHSDAEGPNGDPHAWYQRGLELLSRGSPAAAAQILQRAAAAEPSSRSVREALARAQFDARRYEEAAGNFRLIVEASPTDDYAHFGLGLSLARSGDPASAAEYLALAVAMRPDSKHYANALLAVRATLSRPGESGPADDGGNAAGPMANGPADNGPMTDGTGEDD